MPDFIPGDTRPGLQVTLQGKYAMSVKLSIREQGDVRIVDVSGRLTMGEGANTLASTVHQMATAGQKKMVLNLREVSVLDSAGIGVLVSTFASVNNQGGHLKLENLSSRVKNLLLLTKLYTVFEVYEDEASAVSSFRDSAFEASTTQG